jgi:hypothetical protein
MAVQIPWLTQRATGGALVKPLARDCMGTWQHYDGVKRNRFLNDKVTHRAARSAAKPNSFGHEADNHYI